MSDLGRHARTAGRRRGAPRRPRARHRARNWVFRGAPVWVWGSTVLTALTALAEGPSSPYPTPPPWTALPLPHCFPTVVMAEVVAWHQFSDRRATTRTKMPAPAVVLKWWPGLPLSPAVPRSRAYRPWRDCWSASCAHAAIGSPTRATRSSVPRRRTAPVLSFLCSACWLSRGPTLIYSSFARWPTVSPPRHERQR